MPLCFMIEDKELYLDKVLVEYNELPIFLYAKVNGNILLYCVLTWNRQDTS